MKLNKERHFLKSVGTLMTGSIISQLLTILISPAITRLFDAEELGVYTVVLSSVTMFGAVLSLRYDMSIVSERKESRVYSLVKLSLWLCLGMSVLVALGYYAYFHTLSTIRFGSGLAAIFVFFLVLITGLVNVLTAYNNRICEYRVISTAYVIRTTVQNIGIVLCGLAHFGTLGLLLPQTLGALFGVRRQAGTLIRNGKRLKIVTPASMRAAAFIHRAQAIWSAPSTFLNGFSYSVINLFIEMLFGAVTLGYYSISYRILGLPSMIVSANVSRVFFEKASREQEAEGCFRRTFWSTMRFLLVVAIPMLVALEWLSPWLFALVFGRDWRVAGEYVRILAPMFVLRFIAGGVNGAAIVAGRQKFEFLIQLLLAAVVVAVFLMSRSLGWGVGTFLQAINAGCGVVYVMYILLFWRCSMGWVSSSVRGEVL
jgi:O-antigen/teichoic acid export membrane protein